MRIFNPPVKIIPLSIASERTKEMLSQHTMVANQLHDNVKELEFRPGLLCYCRCADHTLQPLIEYIPLEDVMILELNLVQS